MESNDIIKKIHREAVRKVAAKCAVEGGGKTAVEIGNAIIAYGKTWTEGLANDGVIDEEEIANTCAVFDALVDKNIPNIDGVGVSVAYNGFTIFGFGFKGIKHYLNKWFGLGL